MKIKSIAITNMHNCKYKEYDLAAINYIMGNNGSGKSTILEAIQLALLGYIPGYSKTNQGIMQHANDKMMSVKLTLEDSEIITITRTWIKSGAGVSASVDINPEEFLISDILHHIELPVFNFAEFMTKTANSSKDWFMKFLDSKIRVDWNDIIDKTKQQYPNCSLYSDMQEICNGAGNDIYSIDIVNAKLKSLLSDEKAAHIRDDDTIKNLIYYDDCDTEVLDVTQLKSRLVDVRRLLAQISGIESAKRQNAEIEIKIAALEATLHSEIDNLQDDSVSLQLQHIIEIKQKKLDELKSEQRKVQANIAARLSIIESNGKCPHLNIQCTTLLDKIYDLQYANISDEKQLKQLNSAIIDLANEIDRDTEEYNKMLDTKRRCNSLQEQIRNYKARLIQYTPCVYSEADLLAEQNVITDQMIKMAANTQYKQLQQTLVKSRILHEYNIQMLNYLIVETGVNGFKNNLMQKPFILFEQEMNKYIPKLFGSNTAAKFILLQKANSFSFGIERDGQYIAYNTLSSGEKCLFAICMMLAIMYYTAELHLIMIDDMLDHLDTENLNSLFNILSTIPDIQMIFAGVAKLPQHNANINIIEIER